MAGICTLKQFYFSSTISVALFLTVVLNYSQVPRQVDIIESVSNLKNLVITDELKNGQAEQPSLTNELAIPDELTNEQAEQPASSWLNKLKPEEMSAKEIMDYFSWSNSSSCKLSHDFGGKMLSDPSGLDGQKAVCLQPQPVAPPPGSCLVYSIGINNDWSFDVTMKKYGCTVYAFDPSMKDAKNKFKRSSKIHFYKIGLGTRNYTDESRGWNILSLGSIRRLLGHQDRVIDYLKVDIEGDEWDVIPELMRSGELAQVRQMGFEIHLPSNGPLEEYQELAGVLWSLEREYGMIRFDSKVNPWYMGTFEQLGFNGTFGYEIAWYNSRFL